MLRTLVITLGLGAGMSAWAMESPSDEYRFTVYLDDREIGYHEFSFLDTVDGQTLESEAEFKVKVLFITAFRYEHRNTERWQDGCLREIVSRTSSNGKEFAVDGRSADDRLVVESSNGSSPLTGCIKTFAYWNKDFLNSAKLLNSQTGEYLDVQVEPLGEDLLNYQGREMPVERFRLSAKGVDVEVLYAADSGDWVALDSTIKGGRKLKYRRQWGPNEVLAAN